MKSVVLIAITLFYSIYSNAGENNAVGLQTVIPCSFFPADNIWNTPIDELPLDANSDLYVQTIGTSKNLHPDFGSGEWNGAPMGIPFVLVPGNQPLVNITFQWPDECDPGPYPIPKNPPIEGGYSSTGDRHILIVDTNNCKLYEIYSAYPNADSVSWTAGSGAVFDLKSNNLRPDGWTSSDAAGLPILPGLMRYEEVAAGEIAHAIRFTCPQTRRAYVWPARHYASSLTDTKYPPMGQRFRLKKSVDISGYSSQNQVILKAFKKYGIILADNGSAWFITGAPSPNWNDDDLNLLKAIKGSDFEAVDCSSLMVNSNSGQAKQKASAESEESARNLNLNCFPNPFDSKLKISWYSTGSGRLKIEFTDIFGTAVKAVKIDNGGSALQTCIIDTKDLAPGVYIVSLYRGNEAISRNLLVKE